MEAEALQRIPMSWDEYLALPDLERTEWSHGTTIVSPPPSAHHGFVSANLVVVLKAGLPGLWVMVEAGLKMESSLRGPDLMVTRDLPTGPWVEDPPVLVVEVLSPGTQSEDLLRKAPEYAAAGVGQFWIVDRDHRTLEIQALVDGHWELLVRFDDRAPTGEVVVGGHGVVHVDLLDLLDG